MKRGFKSFNGVVFIVLGAFVIVQMYRYEGLRFEAVTGFVLGAAMIALGAYRMWALTRQQPL